MFSNCWKWKFFIKSKLTNLGGEKCLIIQLILHPGHQVVNVLGRGAFDGLLNIGAISPVILISTETQQSKLHYWLAYETWKLYMHSFCLLVRTQQHNLGVDKLKKKEQEGEMQKYLQSYFWCQQEVNRGLFLLITDWTQTVWAGDG